MLTPDIDPMPHEVLVEFNLPNLFDVSKPSNYSSLTKCYSYKWNLEMDGLSDFFFLLLDICVVITRVC
jgi:hypothetical protein